MTRTVVELLEQALETVTHQQPLLELSETRAQLGQAELQLKAAREREQQTARTFRAVAQRSRQPLFSCPKCRKPVSGSDLLVQGRCPNCANALTTLLLPAPRAGMNQDEYLALINALGVLVGLTLDEPT